MKTKQISFERAMEAVAHNEGIKLSEGFIYTIVTNHNLLMKQEVEEKFSTFKMTIRKIKTLMISYESSLVTGVASTSILKYLLQEISKL